jgi:hypothetical protein
LKGIHVSLRDGGNGVAIAAYPNQLRALHRSMDE